MRTLLLVLGLLPSAALGQDMPVAALPADPAPFAELDAAAVAALRASVARSARVEYAGAILKRGDRYFFTTPVTNGSADDFEYEVDVDREAGYSLAGIYHTHPEGGRDPGLFSPGDVNMARDLGVRSYLLSIPDRVIKVFEPGVTPTRRIGEGARRMLVSRGQTLVTGVDVRQGAQPER